jgi:uncharacterized membrane protein YphA (DoxX/SURF4 family)
MSKYEISGLIIRVILGITFFTHGFVKFQGGIENTVGWLSVLIFPQAHLTSSHSFFWKNSTFLYEMNGSIKGLVIF